MPRSLRSTGPIDNFRPPEISRGRIVEQPAKTPDHPPPVIMAAAAASPIIWSENPNQGDFNPGTKVGRDIFEKKTKGLPDDKNF